jgi:hypothetical protein
MRNDGGMSQLRKSYPEKRISCIILVQLENPAATPPDFFIQYVPDRTRLFRLPEA